MSAFFRILIFVGEFIILWIFTFFAIRKIRKRRKKTKELYGLYKKAKIYNILYFSLNNIILICIFLFTYSSFVFLSYNKMIMMASFIFIYIFLTSMWYNDESFDNSVSAFIGKMVCVFAAVIGLFFMHYATINESAFPNKICVDQKESTEIIYPCVNLKDKAKIGYSLDSDGKICTYNFYYEINGDIYGELLNNKDSYKIIPIKNKDSYLIKYIVTKTFLNKEKKETDKNYKYSEDEITYKFYLNKNDLVEIHNP